MKLKPALITATILTIIALTTWELYWRSDTMYHKIYLEDDRNLFAEERVKVEKATSEDVILIGMSRTGYNINTHVWKETQGIKPIKLTINGKHPGPVLKDIVNNTVFNGTIVFGVVPIAVFGSQKGRRYRVSQEWVNHYYDRTYAQKLGHILSKPLQRNLVLLSSSENSGYNDLDLKSLIKTISTGDGRGERNNFKLVRIGYNDEDRNLIMYNRLIGHSNYQKEITDQWDRVLPGVPTYSDKIEKEVEQHMKELLMLVDAFAQRGGNIIFIRHKAEDGWLKHAEKFMPKAKVWDKFVANTEAATYHFKDYEFMSKHYLPDWSHMNAEDAKIYTSDLVNQLIKDGHLIKH